ncbi:MAG TPA: 2-oxo acid dehydrogenase subunit E2 [Ktedonobacterales bacterium]|nr:2-oxo acid dehydrogenase subunit E2 [Ktedonobacterales bacterium]
MATDVIMPALGMAQETGLLVRWLKAEGDAVSAGDVIAEIQTDKATMELEARASGVLTGFIAHEGEDVPVGAVIATILAPGEAPSTPTSAAPKVAPSASPTNGHVTPASPTLEASPLAVRIASEHGVNLADVPASGSRVQKADVLAYIEARNGRATGDATTTAASAGARLQPASPKARRIARERGVDLRLITGSGPARAVLTADVLAAASAAAPALRPTPIAAGLATSISPIWRIMAERTTQSWQEIPHFFLLREVNANRMIAWRESLKQRQEGGITYTDLLVKVVAETLLAHPRLNGSWRDGGIVSHSDINIGLAVATSDGLVVPVIHGADRLSVQDIAARRAELVTRAQAGKQRPDDLAGATFTISNLGMYGVDAFNAIIPAPQAAILAVGRIVERVVPLNGAPAVQPVMALSLSCDHRVVDGARGAQFLGALAELIEEPLGLLG